jgi:hypothetical protein
MRRRARRILLVDANPGLITRAMIMEIFSVKRA